MNSCPCGFEGWEYGLHTVEWHRAHLAAHLAAFPELDEQSVYNLLRSIQIAEATR